MAKLFVSYSRRDSTAARKLIEAFRSIEQDVWVDWESIPPAVDWLEQIFRGIEESDAFIFLISPDSIASEVCKVEINRAAQHNKRIIPIVLRDVQHKDAPETISKLNWTFIRESDNFEEGLKKVKTAIELDLDWLEEHRRLLLRSLEWHRKKDPSLLLRGRDLRNAKHMVETATSKDPIPTELQQKFIQYSMQSERNRLVTFIATGIAVIALAFLTFLATQARDEAEFRRSIAQTKEVEAVNERQIAETARAEEERQRQIAESARAAEEKQRQIAQANEIEAKAQRSAARAQIFQSRPGELFTSTLLAIDSMRRSPSDEAEEILRNNIRLLPLPEAQFSQAGKINALAFNREGNIFVTGSADGTTCAWQIEDEEIKERFCTASGEHSVNALAFHPDGSQIATGDQAGLVQILSLDGEILYAYQRVEPATPVKMAPVKSGQLAEEGTLLEIPIQGISFHPSNREQIVVAFEDGQIPLFNVKSGAISSRLFSTSKPNVFGLSRRGEWLVAGSEGGRVSIWELLSKNDAVNPLSHRGGVLSIAFHPRENKVITAGNDNAAMINLNTKEVLFRTTNLVRDVAFSPDGNWFVTGSADRRIRLWDTLSGSELRRQAMLQDGIVTEVVVSSSGQWIASTGDDRTVRVWDAATGAGIFQIPLKASGVRLAFCNNDQWLVSTDESGAIAIWDISIMDLPNISMSTPSESIVDHVEYSPSGDRLAVSSENSLWLLTSDPESILKERELSERASPFDSRIKKLVFSPDSTRLGVLTEASELAIYDVGRGTSSSLQVSSPVQDIGFSPDSQQFLTSDAEGNIQVWDLASAEWIESPVQEHAPVFSLATSSQFLAMGSADKIDILGADGNGGIPLLEASGENTLLVFNRDGSLLATSNAKGEVIIWQYQDGQFTVVASFDKERAVSLAFDPEGSMFAVGTATHVYLIDSTGKELARIPHLETVNDVSFSADGKYLTTASSTLLQVWEIAKIQQIEGDELITAACSRLFENFSQAQWEQLFPEEEYLTLCENL